MNAPAAASGVNVLYFAWLRERVGLARETVVLPPEVADVGGLLDYLRVRHPTAFDNAALLRCAVNQEFGDVRTPVRGGDEVAFFPPVTGG